MVDAFIEFLLRDLVGKCQEIFCYDLAAPPEDSSLNNPFYPFPCWGWRPIGQGGFWTEKIMSEGGRWGEFLGTRGEISRIFQLRLSIPTAICMGIRGGTAPGQECAPCFCPISKFRLIGGRLREHFQRKKPTKPVGRLCRLLLYAWNQLIRRVPA